MLISGRSDIFKRVIEFNKVVVKLGVFPQKNGLNIVGNIEISEVQWFNIPLSEANR